MVYTLPKEIKSAMKITKSLYAYDLVFLVCFMCFAWLLDILVYKPLLVPYYIFMFIMGLYLRGNSLINPKKRNFQSIYYIVIRDRKSYIKV